MADNGLFDNQNNEQQVVESKPKIKPLSDKSRSVLFTEAFQKVDESTGKVIVSETRTVKKLKSRNEFVQLYLENINFILNLKPQTIRILSVIIMKMGYLNSINIGADFKTGLSKMLGLSMATIYRAIDELIEREVLLPFNNEEMKTEYEVISKYEYLVNPNIVGKGSFRDLEKLRHDVSRVYDMERMELITNVKSSFDYGLSAELQNNNSVFRVVEHKREQDTQKNKFDETITIQEVGKSPENNELHNLIPPTPKKSESENLEISVEERERKTLELQLELERTKQKNLELEIQNHNLEIKNQLLKNGYVEEALKIQL